ncbi:MAG: cytochrome c [Candidatus Kapabacteria bacterium]|nr:cytochrome c [Candidatus Kapabacteria bacterium]
MNENNQNNIKEEIEFDQVIKSPVRMFGLIYLVTIISIVIVGAFYLRYLDFNSDNNRKFKDGVLVEAESDLPTKRSVSLAGVDVNLVGKPSDILIAKGADSFSKNCVSCHGEKGAGDGVAGAALNPKPRNFTASEGWKNGRKASQIYKTLEEGIKGSGMSSFSHLPVEERFSLIHYIRSLKKDDAPEITEDELAEIDLTYNLSMSRVTKAQIPIAKATEILINESNSSKKAQVDLILTKANKEDKAKVLTSVILNKERAIKFLLDNKSWKSNVGEFLKSVSSSTPQNGFKTEISKLSKDDLNNVYSYLISLYNN